MEYHTTTENDPDAIGSASQPRSGHAYQDQKVTGSASQPAPNDDVIRSVSQPHPEHAHQDQDIRGHASQPSANKDVIGSASQPRPDHLISQHDDVVGSASQPRAQPVDRSHVRFVEPDTPLSTECLVQLIFDAYSSRNHASVKIITPLKPEESPKKFPDCLKTLTERPWTLCELEHGKIGDLEVVVATKEEHACLLSRDVLGDSSRERSSLLHIYGWKPDFNQIEEEHGLKVLAWAVRGTIQNPFMDREGMSLMVSCFSDGPRRE